MPISTDEEYWERRAHLTPILNRDATKELFSTIRCGAYNVYTVLSVNYHLFEIKSNKVAPLLSASGEVVKTLALDSLGLNPTPTTYLL